MREQQEDTECAICLQKVTEKAIISSCDHNFCFVCLLEWSKVTNKCPLCQITFTSLARKTADGNVGTPLKIVNKDGRSNFKNISTEDAILLHIIDLEEDYDDTGEDLDDFIVDRSPRDTTTLAIRERVADRRRRLALGDDEAEEIDISDEDEVREDDKAMLRRQGMPSFSSDEEEEGEDVDNSWNSDDEIENIIGEEKMGESTHPNEHVAAMIAEGEEDYAEMQRRENGEMEDDDSLDDFIVPDDEVDHSDSLNSFIVPDDEDSIISETESDQTNTPLKRKKRDWKPPERKRKKSRTAKVIAISSSESEDDDNVETKEIEKDTKGSGKDNESQFQIKKEELDRDYQKKLEALRKEFNLA